MPDAVPLTPDMVRRALQAFADYVDARPRAAAPVDAEVMRAEGFPGRLERDGVVPAGPVAFAVAAFDTYVRVCRENRYPLAGVCVGHSALLRRLLGGKPPLPKPPPLCGAYPWYALAEGKRIRVRRMWRPFFAPACVSIESNDTIFDVLSPTRLREQRTGEVYALSRAVHNFEHDEERTGAPAVFIQKEAPHRT